MHFEAINLTLLTVDREQVGNHVIRVWVTVVITRAIYARVRSLLLYILF